MFGKGIHQEEETLLRDIIRSINKKIDYTAREGGGSQFTLHFKLRGHEAHVSLIWRTLKLLKTIWSSGTKFGKKSKLDTITWTNRATAKTFWV
jgi:hypothetical protein